MSTIESNWLMNSNDFEQRERWKAIIAERERKRREFNRRYQLIDVEDYFNYEAPTAKKKPPEGGKK